MPNFFEEEINKKIENKINIRSKKVLLAGNGLSLLATESGLTWETWIKKCWECPDLENKIPFEYVKLKGLTLPECLDFIFDKIDEEVSEIKKEENKKKIYKILWEKTEGKECFMETDIHKACIDAFDIIFTTNYDTFFERVAKECGKTYKVIDFISQKYINFGKNIKYIIKLHGSFHNPKNNINFDSFDSWYDYYKSEANHLSMPVAGFIDYQKLMLLHKKLEKIVKDIKDRPLIIMGHGLGAAENLVYNLVQRFKNKVVFTFGADEIEEQRLRILWSAGCVNVSGKRAEDRQRYGAHHAFIKFCSPGSTVELKSKKRETARILLFGDATINNYFDTKDFPQPERGYRIENPDLIGEQNGCIPATFLDLWNVPTTFASIIGYDEPGYELIKHLKTMKNIDWFHLQQKKDYTTTYLYILLQNDMRTCFIKRDKDEKEPKGLIKTSLYGGPKRKYKGILGDIRKGDLNPVVTYFSPYWCEEIASFINKENIKNKSLIAFETHTNGFNSFEKTETAGCLDIILSSSLFAVKMGGLKLTAGNYSLLNRKYDLKNDWKNWDDTYNINCAKFFSKYHNSAYANIVFINALAKQDRVEAVLKKNLFKHTAAEWWIITLGEFGMIAIPKKGEPFWIKLPEGEKIKEKAKNASGCGDVARVAFLTHYYFWLTGNSGHNKKMFLSDHKEIKKAVKIAVAVGAEKIKCFDNSLRKQDDKDNLDWDKFKKLSNKSFENIGNFAQISKKAKEIIRKMQNSS